MQCSHTTVQEWRHLVTISMQPLASMLEENTTRTILSVDLVSPTMWLVVDRSGTLWFTGYTYMLILFSRSEPSVYKCTRKMKISLITVISHFSPVWQNVVPVHFSRPGEIGDSKSDWRNDFFCLYQRFPTLGLSAQYCCYRFE